MITLEEKNQNLQWLFGFAKKQLHKHKNELKELKEEKLKLEKIENGTR